MSLKAEPLVSIIIPVYNGSNYLKHAIKSALSQTYQNIEVVVINDGSNDNGATERIALEYKDSIRYYSKPNGGVGSALNFGIKAMKGCYFSWLSHDDIYLPSKLQTQIDFLKGRNEPVVLYSDYYLINQSGKQIGKVVLDHEMLKEKKEYALLRGSVNGCTMLIPKECFFDVGFFNESLKTTQDYDLWKRFIKKYDFIHIDEVLVGTRIHAMQDSKKHNDRFAEGDALWIGMMEELDQKTKNRLEGSEYQFYIKMESFLSNTFYKGAKTYALRKAEELLKKAEDIVDGVLVTVIIPFYNRVQTTLRAIDSVIQQTHKNWELILVNDGSTEDISAIQEKVDSDIRIKLFSLIENSGPAIARNYALERSNGDYVAFLDSDDRFLPNKLRLQLTLMVASNSVFSHTSFYQIINNEKISIHSGVLTGFVLPQIIDNCIMATPTVVLESELAKKHRFPTNFRLGEDVCMWLELSKASQLLGIDIELSEVYVDTVSASVDIEKKLNGLRNILFFVVKDDQLCIHQRNVDIMCMQIGALSQKYWYEVNSELKKRKKSNSFIKKVIVWKAIARQIVILFWKLLPKKVRRIIREIVLIGG